MMKLNKTMLTITLVLSIPTMISSFMGMNVEFPFDTTRIGFYGIIILSVLVTIIITYFLKKKDLL